VLSGEGQSLETLEATYQQRQGELEDPLRRLDETAPKGRPHLEKRLVTELKPLAMEQVQFQVALEPTAPGPTGADRGRISL
jgi:DNA repair protein RecN (Recombination protein N)